MNSVWIWVQTVLKVTSRPLNLSFYLGHHCLLIYLFMGFPVHKGLRVKVNNESMRKPNFKIELKRLRQVCVLISVILKILV